MRYCSSCGSPLGEGVEFCGSCGMPVPSTGAAQSPGAPPAAAPISAAGASDMTRALPYLLTVLTGLYFLLAEPYRRDRVMRFHALQAIFFYLAAVIVWAIYWAGSTLLVTVGFGFSVWITYPISIILALAMAAYWIFLMYKAYRGEIYKIPRLGDLAESAAAPDELPQSVAGFLTYTLAFITGIVFLLVSRYKRDSFVRFHAFQSIFASIAYVIIVIVLSALISALFFSGGFMLWRVVVLLFLAFRLAVLAGWFYLMYEAYQGRRPLIPGIAELAAKQAS